MRYPYHRYRHVHIFVYHRQKNKEIGRQIVFQFYLKKHYDHKPTQKIYAYQHLLGMCDRYFFVFGSLFTSAGAAAALFSGAGCGQPVKHSFWKEPFSTVQRHYHAYTDVAAGIFLKPDYQPLQLSGEAFLPDRTTLYDVGQRVPSLPNPVTYAVV